MSLTSSKYSCELSDNLPENEDKSLESNDSSTTWNDSSSDSNESNNDIYESCNVEKNHQFYFNIHDYNYEFDMDNANHDESIKLKLSDDIAVIKIENQYYLNIVDLFNLNNQDQRNIELYFYQKKYPFNTIFCFEGYNKIEDAEKLIFFIKSQAFKYGTNLIKQYSRTIKQSDGTKIFQHYLSCAHYSIKTSLTGGAYSFDTNMAQAKNTRKQEFHSTKKE